MLSVFVAYSNRLNVFKLEGIVDGGHPFDPVIHGPRVRLVDGHAFLGQCRRVVDGKFLHFRVGCPIILCEKDSITEDSKIKVFTMTNKNTSAMKKRMKKIKCLTTKFNLDNVKSTNEQFQATKYSRLQQTSGCICGRGISRIQKWWKKSCRCPLNLHNYVRKLEKSPCSKIKEIHLETHSKTAQRTKFHDGFQLEDVILNCDLGFNRCSILVRMCSAKPVNFKTSVNLHLRIIQY